MSDPTLPLNPDNVANKVRDLSRDPFKDLLANVLGCAPDEKTIQKFAKKFPDKYAGMIKTYSELAGYQSKMLATEITIYQQINNMPDSQLNDELQRLMVELKDDVIEGETVPSLEHETVKVSD
jgi:hypothetical protein